MARTGGGNAVHGLGQLSGPAFHCSRNPQGMLIQAGLTWLGSWYLGVGAVMLRLWRLAGTQSTRLALDGAGCIQPVHGLGQPRVGVRVAQAIAPLTGFIRFPIKFLVLATLSFRCWRLWVELAAGGARWKLAARMEENQGPRAGLIV